MCFNANVLNEKKKSIMFYFHMQLLFYYIVDAVMLKVLA